jgi:HlyD family secretion protein/epimerase transport system membrane fusion protein
MNALAPALTLDLRRSVRGPLVAGVAITACFFGGLTAWSSLAPLASAALGHGVVSPDGSRRTVQHLEGGIVERLLVHEGSRVERGQPLLVLEDKSARAVRDTARSQARLASAVLARLQAERTNAPAISFQDDPLSPAGDPEVINVRQAQRELFLQRRESLAGRKALLDRRLGQLREEINGLKAQMASQTAQLNFVNDELQGVTQLVSQGLERKPRLLALQRSQADLSGQKAASQAGIARAEQAISETRLQMTALDSERQEEVSNQLATVAGDLSAAQDRYRAAQDVLHRVTVTAPVAGTVVQLKAKTVGGVVGAGQSILDIVPSDDELLIEARIAPTDIDVVRSGLPAQVVFSAFKQRNLPRLEGRVRDVSADRITDPQSGNAFYLARVEVDRGHIRSIAPELELTAGMPAEVMIMSGEKTLFQYLVEPLRDSLRRSFRES